MIEVNRFRLITRLDTSDTLLKHQCVEKDHQEGEEVAVEVVLARLDLVGIHGDNRGVLNFAKVAVRLSLVHVPWLQFQEEVLDFETELLDQEPRFLECAHTRVLNLPEVLLFL